MPRGMYYEDPHTPTSSQCKWQDGDAVKKKVWRVGVALFKQAVGVQVPSLVGHAVSSAWGHGVIVVNIVEGGSKVFPEGDDMIPCRGGSHFEVAHHRFPVVPQGLANLEGECGGRLYQRLLAALTGVSLLLGGETREPPG